MTSIDLNSDLGESFGAWQMGDDEAILEVVTSANVACGFHAGDPSTLRRTCALAAERAVTVGAHVGYPDLVGFGRRYVDMGAQELTDAVIYQLGALDAFAQVAGTGVRYLKPHGALYHACIDNEVHADAVVRAVIDFDPSLVVMGFPGSRLLALADEQGLAGVGEAFADRAYNADGTLVGRSRPGAVIGDVAVAARRAVSLATGQPIETIDGTEIVVDADSICIHGDTPGAADVARAIRAALDGAGVDVRPFRNEW